MSWTNDSQARLNRLRDRELAGTLTEPEQVELAALMAEVEAEEAGSLAPAMQRLRAEVHQLEREIATVQGGERGERPLARAAAGPRRRRAALPRRIRAAAPPFLMGSPGSRAPHCRRG
jgi:hypothetical protein